MKKRGFTLIEMIAIITLLALIILVALPSMTKTLKRNEQKKYDNYINDLKLVSESYLVEQLQKNNIIFKDDIAYFTLGDIIDAGYVTETIINPDNNKKISRDTRIKVTKNIDSTYSFDVQEYYNNISDYDKTNLVIHYDSVKYTGLNKFENNTTESDYNFGENATWTEDGMLFEKESNAGINLTNSYTTDSITVSFNLKSLEDLGNCGDCYTYPVHLLYNGTNNASFGFRHNSYLFYKSGNNTILYSTSLVKNKNYTITFVQEGLTKRRVYVNGVLETSGSSSTGLTLETISYNQIRIAPFLYNLKINNVLVYNRALTDAEIENLYTLDKDRFGE